MNSHQVLRRLEAFRVGRPLPQGETLHFPIAAPEDLLLLAFVRMGGESAPWGVAFGHPGNRPTVLTVPEPRNRDLVADMAAAFAPTLLKLLRHPAHSAERIDGPEGRRSLRQVWLPNPTHLDMLHHLAYAYTFTRWGAPARAQLLNQLGRAANWLFQEAHRPGQITVMVGTEALRESFTFPAEDVRQAHLGFLLAWLTAQGKRQARLEAAVEAERQSVATSLDPELERTALEPLVTRWNEARGDDSAQAALARRIRPVLEPELLRRLQLTEQTLNLLRADRRRGNAGVAVLETMAQEEHWYRYLRLEKRLDDEADGPAFIPSPETDRYAPAAAARFFAHEEAEEVRYSALIHDDSEIQADAIAAGDAFRGRIVKVRDEGRGRGTEPVWVLEDLAPGPLRLREGSYVCVVGVPKRTGTIRHIEPTAHGGRRYEVVITGWKRARHEAGRAIPAAHDPTLVGHEVLMVEATAAGLVRRKGQRVWERNVPGAWLTHAAPKGPVAQLPEDVGEDLEAIASGRGGRP
jgi:hypothetical protein